MSHQCLNAWRQRSGLIEAKVDVLNFVKATLEMPIGRRNYRDKGTLDSTICIDSQPKVETISGTELRRAVFLIACAVIFSTVPLASGVIVSSTGSMIFAFTTNM
jgi:hypothetical protein